jgi:hypothetical protein
VSLARIVLTGSRTWPAPQLLEDVLLDTWHDAVQDGHAGILLTHGACDTGADHIGDTWAHRHGVARDPHPADWVGPCGPDCPPGHRKQARGREYCPRAGHRRNQEMIYLQPVLVIAAHHQQSRGTADCLRRAHQAGIPTRVITT